MKKEPITKQLLNYAIIIFGTFLYVLAMNMFITPAALYTGGVTGIAQLLNLLLKVLFNVELGLGVLIFLLNVPILYLGWKTIGRRFTLLSIFAVIIQFIMFELVPIGQFSEDVLLNSVFGGVLIGLGAGMVLKVGGSTGGMDIISQYISQKYSGSLGTYSFAINAFIILIAGFTQSWEVALYTIISIYITSTLIDKIHTIHQNLTLYIVTDKEDEMVKAIYDQVYRGVTVLEGRGGYTKQDKSVLMMVLSSYEMYEVLALIREVDEKAFTNVVRSEHVQGNYVKKKLN